MRIIRLIAMATVLALAPGAVGAVDREIIERRVAEAAALFEAEGFEALCAAVSDPSGPYLVDEAYVFALIRDGRLVCHPRPDLIERQAGQPSNVPEMLRNTERRPEGAWTRYPWPHPETLEMGVKSTYCRISGPLAICAGGYFDVGLV